MLICITPYVLYLYVFYRFLMFSVIFSEIASGFLFKATIGHFTFLVLEMLPQSLGEKQSIAKRPTPSLAEKLSWPSAKWT